MFMYIIDQWADHICCDSKYVYDRETERRGFFIQNFNQHFLQKVIPCFSDQIPEFAVRATSIDLLEEIYSLF